MLSTLEAVNTVISIYQFEQDSIRRPHLLRMHGYRFGPLTKYYLGRLSAIQSGPYYYSMTSTSGRLRRVLTVYKESGVSNMTIDEACSQLGEECVNRWIDGTSNLINDREIVIPCGYGAIMIREYSQYLDRCFQGLTCVHVARIDLKYLKDVEASLDKVRSDLRRWTRLRHTDDMLKQDRLNVGYIWRIERGELLGKWHVHCLLFYREGEGSIESHLKRLSDGWERISGGVTYVQYSKVPVVEQSIGDIHGYPCTGIVRLDDPRVMIGLAHILLYFFKGLGNGGDGRMIGRGQLPTERQSDVVDV